MRSYKIFYPADNGRGKWHTCDSVTGVASCHSQLVDRTADAIHVLPNQKKVHPLVCKKCLNK